MRAGSDPLVKEKGVVGDAQRASGVNNAAYVVPPSKFQLASVDTASFGGVAVPVGVAVEERVSRGVPVTAGVPVAAGVPAGVRVGVLAPVAVMEAVGDGVDVEVGETVAEGEGYNA